MIDKSFIFLEKIGETSERKIWDQDIHTWDDFLGCRSIAGMSRARKLYYDRQIMKAVPHLKKKNHFFFRKAFPFSHQWRLYNQFKDDAVFLDIETSGYYGSITVIGLYDGKETKTMVRGFNLDKRLFEKEMSKYKMVITFNGASFDLPVIRRYFGTEFDMPHIDLRWVCKKIDLVGGLKSIEKQMRIRRADELTDISGEDAVYLWQQWRSTGNRKYLDLLVQYNEEDIINLKPIAEFAVKELWKRTKVANNALF